VFKCLSWRELCRWLIGDALQDRFAVFARELVDRGKRVLALVRAAVIVAFVAGVIPPPPIGKGRLAVRDRLREMLSNDQQLPAANDKMRKEEMARAAAE
jgi:hypothetical protein